jgi:hypothetical protein
MHLILSLMRLLSSTQHLDAMIRHDLPSSNVFTWCLVDYVDWLRPAEYHHPEEDSETLDRRVPKISRHLGPCTHTLKYYQIFTLALKHGTACLAPETSWAEGHVNSSIHEVDIILMKNKS